jgi:predicted phage-related endonuclease
MPVERIPITSREQWLELRRKDVTASVVGALWGYHPFQTIASVWAEKMGILIPNIDTAVMRRGQRLEPVVAEMVREERPEWHIEKSTHYLRDPDIRFGATPDFTYVDQTGLAGILQTKTVSPQQFAEHWDEQSPPLWVVLQTLSEMMLADAAIGTVAALVIDAWTFDLHLYELARHASAEARIIGAIERFWRETDRGNQPDIDPGRDGALLDALYPTHVPAKLVDLPPGAVEVIDRYVRMDEAIKIARSALETDKNTLKAWLKDAEAGFVIDDKTDTSWVVTLKQQTRRAHEVQKASFRKLRVRRTQIREK